MRGDNDRSAVSTQCTSTEKAVRLLLPLAVCFLCFIWSLRLPVEMAPDESMRLMIPFYIVEHGRLPIGSDPAIRNSIWGTSYGFVPYTSSLISALFIKFIELFSSDVNVLIAAARFVDPLFAGLTVYVCEQIGLRIYGRGSSILLGVIVGLLPQFVFLGCYLNNDMFTIFCSSLVILGWIKGWQQHWDRNSSLFLGVSLGLTAISYYFAYGYLLISVAYYFISNWLMVDSAHSSKSAGKRVLRGAIVIALVAFAIGGWFFVRNIILYDGDVFGMRTSASFSELYAKDGFKPSQHTSPDDFGISPLAMIFGNGSNSWLVVSLKSSIGVFGMLNIFLPRLLYLAYGAFFGVGFLFWVHKAYASIRTSEKYKILLFACLILAMLIPFVLSAYYSWSSDYQAQGRYFSSGFIPMFILVTSGYRELASCVSKCQHDGLVTAERKIELPRRVTGPSAMVMVAVVYIALFLATFISTILPYCMQ